MEPNDKLDAAVQAMIDQPVPLGPPATIDAEVLVQIHRADRQRSHAQPTRFFARPLVRFALAAAVVLAVLVPALWLTLGSGAELTFAQVLDKIRAARSVTFHISMPMKDMDKPIDIFIMTAGERTRVENSLDGRLLTVTIFDAGAHKMMVQEPNQKIVIFAPYGATQPASNATPARQENPGAAWEWLRSLKPDAANKSGTRVINGRTAQGFRVKQLGQEYIVWVDPTTAQPIEVQKEYVADGTTASVLTMRDFHFDVSLDESLFDMNAPAGYTDQTDTLSKLIPKGTPDETVIGLLRMYTQLSGGTFPVDFEAMTVFKVFEHLTPTTQPDQAQSRQAQVQQMTALYSGSYAMFVALGKDGWGYLGKGVTLADATRPVLWYHVPGPPERRVYRVVYGDLHTEDFKDRPALAVPATQPAGDVKK